MDAPNMVPKDKGPLMDLIILPAPASYLFIYFFGF